MKKIRHCHSYRNYYVHTHTLTHIRVTFVLASYTRLVRLYGHAKVEVFSNFTTYFGAKFRNIVTPGPFGVM